MEALVLVPGGRHDERGPVTPSHVVERTVPALGGRVARRGEGGSQLRLTRRGRALLVAGALLLGAALGFFGGRVDAVAAPEPPETVGVVIERGDTLWGLASRAAVPGEDLRDVVREIQALNDMTSADLVVGEVVEIPVV